MPHGQPAAAGSSGGNPLLSLQGVLADTDSSGENGLLYGVNESTYSITANVKAREGPSFQQKVETGGSVFLVRCSNSSSAASAIQEARR